MSASVLDRTLKAYRIGIGDNRYPIFDGTGAKLYPGRWNANFPVIYSGENYSLAMLEKLVHSNTGDIPVQQQWIEIVIRVGTTYEVVTDYSLPNWKEQSVSKAFGDNWLESNRSCILIVPSAIAPVENNILINEAHPQFPSIKTSLNQLVMFYMTQPLLCHLLVGLPSSGKSTFAQQLNQQIPNSVIISTDAIRFRLYGDESIQGNWGQIEEAVIEQIRLAITYEQTVIYDATNVRLAWRNSILDKVSDLNSEWIAWWIKTPVNVCKYWNRRRSRQVPNRVINIYYDDLIESPPTVKEGFLAVRAISF